MGSLSFELDTMFIFDHFSSLHNDLISHAYKEFFFRNCNLRSTGLLLIINQNCWNLPISLSIRFDMIHCQRNRMARLLLVASLITPGMCESIVAVDWTSIIEALKIQSYQTSNSCSLSCKNLLIFCAKHFSYLIQEFVFLLSEQIIHNLNNFFCSF